MFSQPCCLAPSVCSLSVDDAPMSEKVSPRSQQQGGVRLYRVWLPLSSSVRAGSFSSGGRGGARGGTGPFPRGMKPASPTSGGSEPDGGVLPQPCAPPSGGPGELKKGRVKLGDALLVFDFCPNMGTLVTCRANVGVVTQPSWLWGGSLTGPAFWKAWQ